MINAKNVSNPPVFGGFNELGNIENICVYWALTKIGIVHDVSLPY
jgi:hypothetical protein